MTEIKLLPCPFCGAEGEIERKGDRRQSTIYACVQCSCRLETGEEWDHGKVWNRRAALSSAAVAEREPVAFPECVLGLIDGRITLAFETSYDAQVGFEMIERIISTPPASELEAENARLKARLAEVEKALDGLLEPFDGDDCRCDHHGYCQAHFLQECDECCVKIARRVREGGKVDG